jgi:hypothetical protein
LAKVRIHEEAVGGQKVNTEDWFCDGSQDECAEKGPESEIQNFFDGSP